MLVFLFGVVALAVLVMVTLMVCGRLLVRNQRTTVERLRRDGLAFLCRPTLGLRRFAGFVLSVDHAAVSLWRVGLGRPVRQHSFPSYGAQVAPATVRVNTARQASGLSVTSATGERIDVAIYPDPTMGYSRPLDGPSLDQAYQQVRRTLSDAAARH